MQGQRRLARSRSKPPSTHAAHTWMSSTEPMGKEVARCSLTNRATLCRLPLKQRESEKMSRSVGLSRALVHTKEHTVAHMCLGNSRCVWADPPLQIVLRVACAELENDISAERNHNVQVGEGAAIANGLLGLQLGPDLSLGPTRKKEKIKRCEDGEPQRVSTSPPSSPQPAPFS